MQFKPTLSLLVLTYLKLMARIRLARVKPIIIGITGSAGKSSTLNAAAAVVHSIKPKVAYKANSESGIPLDVLDLQPKDYSLADWLSLVGLACVRAFQMPKAYTHYLVEMGIDSPEPPRNMGYLLSIVQPQVGVFLNAEPVHSYAFDNLLTTTDPKLRRRQMTQVIAAEKGKLITGLPAHGYAILNHDQPEIIALAKQTHAKVLTFGTHSDSTIRITSHKVDLTGTAFRFVHLQQRHTLFLPNLALPNHYAYSFGAALCIGLSQGLNFKTGLLDLATHLSLPPSRATLLKGVQHSLILDSSYNASAAPTIDLLELLNKIPAKRRFALVGDMRELGEESAQEHQQVFQVAKDIVDHLFLVGPLTKQHIIAHFLPDPKRVSWFPNADDAAKRLKSILETGDILLVKGSQNTIFLEAAVKQLLLQPEKDAVKLCRQSDFWTKQRQLSGLQA